MQNRERTLSSLRYAKVIVFSTYLYGTVEVPGEAVLNEQCCKVEHSQQQGFELTIVWPVTHQQPRHILHGLSCVAQNAIEAV